MSQVNRSTAIKNFLTAFTHPDLAELYTPEHEVQVKVGQDGGDVIEGKYKERQWRAYTDSVQTWKDFRIPWKASSEPESNDHAMSYDLVQHAEGIGMTGWNWAKRLSCWFGFDFDAITNHSEQHARKLTDAQLAEVREQACAIPWVTVRKSTSGKGLHLYVFIDSIHTANHTEHAAVARSILDVMSGIAGFDFRGKVDIMGGNMWVWHRKMRGTDGLTLIKQGTKLHEIPPNWRDHIKVITGKRRKIIPQFIEESTVDTFEELTGQNNHIPLEPEHKKLMQWLTDNGYAAWWQQDHHMLITHTYGLALAHEALNLKGIFKTLAKGSEPGDHNVFLFPLRRGAWAARRYTQGVREESTWDQDGSGWTRTFYNREPDLPTASRAFEGIEDPSNGFFFLHAEDAKKAALTLGADLHIPGYMYGRKTKLKDKDGKLVVEIAYETSDNPRDMEGWIQKGKIWTRMYNVQTTPPTAIEIRNYDDTVRHLVTVGDEDYGWVIQSDGAWRIEPLVHVRTALRSTGLDTGEVGAILGAGIFKPWTVVNYPFQPEYPGDRKWNKGGAQFRFFPSANLDNINYPTWMKVLGHIGAGLDDAIKNNAWARANSVYSGADYLKCWIASMFQYPALPLPYLFLYSPEQNTGKSILHEGLSLLMSKGVVRADQALMSQGNFNGELENAVLCVIEETNVSKAPSAYNRIKDWITCRLLPVHRKGETPYSIINTTHWMQCANDFSYCPVYSGDTRIVMIRVNPIDPADLIPKTKMLALMEKEAPDFLADMLAYEIPASDDRLNLPVIITEEKVAAEQSNRTLLEMFLDENCHYIPGIMISIADFYERFKEWLDPNYISEWTKIRVGREMPIKYVKGRNPKNGQWNWGNISWEPQSGGAKLIVRNEMLIPSREEGK